ncbi:MAG: SapC family protein [Sphingomonadaceae bacterium]
MTQSALLNNIDHYDLRVITRHGAEFGDNVMSALTFPAEFRNLQAYYPIVLQKSHDGSTLVPLALFGFEEGENLFLDSAGWDATYVPLTIERHPFQIGVNGEQLTLNIDVDHPRISRTEGEVLFLPQGGTTPYIDRINSVLMTIHEGIQSTPAFIAALVQLELVESFVLDITMADGSQHRLVGFYTIHEERLGALGADALAALHQAGYLQAIYMMIASMTQFRALIERKNRAYAARR